MRKYPKKDRVPKRKRLFIVGEISFESYKEFAAELGEAESERCTQVDVELFSDGGDAHAALAFFSRIKGSSCEVRIIALGNVASAAVLILASGDYRVMTKEAWVMVHEEQCELPGSVSDLERETKQLRRLEDQWSDLLHKYTKTTHPGVWSEMHKQTTYLDADECLELGLVDEVI